MESRVVRATIEVSQEGYVSTILYDNGKSVKKERDDVPTCEELEVTAYYLGQMIGLQHDVHKKRIEVPLKKRGKPTKKTNKKT